jgi:ABC-type sugar transport system ATPase subunit
VTERKLAEAIGGPNATRTVAREAVHEIRRDVPPAIELRDVQLRDNRAGVSIDVAPGEIVGVTGLLGAGSARLVAGVGGAEPFASKVYVNGEPVHLNSPAAARRAGIGFIHEDRKKSGVVPDQSVANNIALASLENVSRGPWIDRGAIDRQAEKFREQLNIRLSSIHAPVRSLSGGNQQKVLLARWLASGVKVLAIDEPTHGVDVGGKSQIHALLREFADAGGAVLVASTDVGEVLDLCDRVAVLRHGELAAFKDIHGLTRADLTVLGTQEAA